MQGHMADLIARAGARYGDETAVTVLGGGAASFAELDDYAARFAGGLEARSVKRGDRVVLHVPNSVEWIAAYHAIARIGAVVVPANILNSPAEVAFMATDSGARLIILSEDKLDAVRGALDDHPIDIIALTPGDRRAWEALIDHPPLPPVDMEPDALFTLGYTSGTTGRPKGAMLTHCNVFTNSALMATLHIRTRGESVLTGLPFSHVYGNVVMNSALMTGMRVIAMPRFEAGAALHAIEQERPTMFEGVPTMFYQMLAHPAMPTTDFSSLTRCTVGGQTIPTATIDEVVERFGCPMCEVWGMTEVGGIATTHSPYWPPRHGSIGLPFPSVEMRVANLQAPETDAEPGEAGELWVRGPIVTKGYWRREDATAQAFAAGGWLKTGDIAIRDADYYLTIVDRCKDLIITGGYNVYPAEVEQVLATHPAVSMVAVTSVPDKEKGEIAKAFVVLRPGAECAAAELQDHCRQHLARYKIPRDFAFVDDLPKTSTGKVMRRALREETVAEGV